MRIDTILALVTTGLIVAAVALMANNQVGTGFVLIAVACIVGIVGYRIHLNIFMRRDLIGINSKHSPELVKQTVSQVFATNKWKNVSGPGEINYQYLKLGGMIDGPVVSAALTELNQSMYELELWVSHCPTSGKNKTPKHSGKAIKVKKQIAEACAKFV